MSLEVNMLPEDDLPGPPPPFAPNGLRQAPTSAHPASSSIAFQQRQSFPAPWVPSGPTQTTSPAAGVAFPWPHSSLTPGAPSPGAPQHPAFSPRWPDSSAAHPSSPTSSAFPATPPGFHARGGGASTQLPLSPPHFEESPLPPCLMRSRSCHPAFAIPAFASPAAMTESFSDLSLGEEAPPPGKIRRRNALTEGDIFSTAEVMQRLENLNSAAMQQQGDGRPLHVELGHLSIRQRKKAVPRTAARRVSTCRVPPSMDEDEGGGGCGRQWSISLHEDLQRVKPKKLVPESLVEHYLKKERNALVLYRPPQSIVEQLLSRASGEVRGDGVKCSSKEEEEEDSEEQVEEVEMD